MLRVRYWRTAIDKAVVLGRIDLGVPVRVGLPSWVGAREQKGEGGRVGSGQPESAALGLGQPPTQCETDAVPEGPGATSFKHGRRVAAQRRAFVGDVDGDRFVEGTDGDG